MTGRRERHRIARRPRLAYARTELANGQPRLQPGEIQHRKPGREAPPRTGRAAPNRGQITQESRSSVPGIAVKYAGIRSLHGEYPRLGLNRTGPRSAGVHQRPPRLASMPRAHWTPSPCTRLSRARTTTGPPPHFAGIDRRQVFPAVMAGTDEVVPTFTLEPFNGVGAQLCPCNLATATPQSFTVASRPAT